MPVSRDSDRCHRDVEFGSVINDVPDDLQESLLWNNRNTMSSRSLLDGPKQLVDPHVTMFFKQLQIFPTRLLNRRRRILQWPAYFFFLFLWAFMFYELVNRSILAIPTIDNEPVQLLPCNGVPDVWRGKNELCGLNGTDCSATHIGQEFKFKCLAGCSRDSWTYSEFPVGDYEAIYRPYVIGGDNIYRADSFVCAAGVHGGAISDRTGGCGIVRFVGPWDRYNSTIGNEGMRSIGFDSIFPASFSFVPLDGVQVNGCSDLRSFIIFVNIAFSLVFGYFVSDALAFFWPILLIGFWTVILVSNPPLTSSNNSGAELVSLGFKRLLPTMFVGYTIYMTCTKPQLEGLNSNLSRTIFWLAGFWISVLENYTFGLLPVDRLTVHDLNAQPGAWLATILLTGFVMVATVGQAYMIWRAGRLRNYLFGYISLFSILFLLAWVPNETLRIHHYIIGLILVPGTAFKTTPSLFYQGLAVGLFISGVARWDFDSILQTYDQLRRGGPTLVGGIPEFLEPAFRTDITLSWKSLNRYKGIEWDGFSLIINDVEQYRGSSNEFSLSGWIRNNTIGFDPIEYYVRLAFTKMSNGNTGDYTKAGVINVVSGNWAPPHLGAV